MIQFKRRALQVLTEQKDSISGARWLTLLGLVTVLVPRASAAGICLTAGSSLYGGGILATAPAPFEAGCTYGFLPTWAVLEGLLQRLQIHYRHRSQR